MRGHMKDLMPKILEYYFDSDNSALGDAIQEIKRLETYHYCFERGFRQSKPRDS